MSRTKESWPCVARRPPGCSLSWSARGCCSPGRTPGRRICTPGWTDWSDCCSEASPLQDTPSRLRPRPRERPHRRPRPQHPRRPTSRNLSSDRHQGPRRRTRRHQDRDWPRYGERGRRCWNGCGSFARRRGRSSRTTPNRWMSPTTRSCSAYAAHGFGTRWCREMTTSPIFSRPSRTCSVDGWRWRRLCNRPPTGQPHPHGPSPLLPRRRHGSGSSPIASRPVPSRLDPPRTLTRRRRDPPNPRAGDPQGATHRPRHRPAPHRPVRLGVRPRKPEPARTRLIPKIRYSTTSAVPTCSRASWEQASST